MHSGPVDLICHAATPSTAVDRITVSAGFNPGTNTFDATFILFGDHGRISFPPIQKPGRADELWRATCFEIFIEREGGGYLEFNFSPSGQWAAYGFDSYRIGMAELPIEHPFRRVPVIFRWDDFDGPTYLQGVDCDTGWGSPEAKALGLSAIIEETDGTKSYWALRHPPGKPDFHHKDCFALQLAPREAP